MTAKEKVQKIRPDAVCLQSKSSCNGNLFQIISQQQMIGFDYHRESWAWAEAYRNLVLKPLNADIKK